MPVLNVRMGAEGHFENAMLISYQCTGKVFQKFKLPEDGQKKLLAKPNLCVVIAEEKYRNGRGMDAPHLKRALMLQECVEVDPRLTHVALKIEGSVVVIW